MKKRILSIMLATLVLTGCSVVNQLTGAVALSQANYSFNSISNLQLANIHIGGGNTLSLSNIASIATLLAGNSNQSIPLSMNLNLNVENPNPVVAFLNELHYSIQINDMQFTTGTVSTPLRVEPGQTVPMAISLGVDVRNLISQHSQQQVSSILSSFLGVTNNPANVTVQLRPTFMVGNTAIPSPVAIPLSFSFGGRS